MPPKRPYHSPQVRKYSSPEELPLNMQAAARELLIKASPIKTILDRDRRWVSVSDGFAAMLGYRTMDLIGRRIDDFTVPGSVDIEFVFQTYFKVGELDGIWMFRHKEGHSVVVHYHAKLRDELSYADLQPLLVA